MKRLTTYLLSLLITTAVMAQPPKSIHEFDDGGEPDDADLFIIQRGDDNFKIEFLAIKELITIETLDQVPEVEFPAPVSRLALVDTLAGDDFDDDRVFSTIGEAMTFVATQSPGAGERWQVRVDGGGPYSEAPFTVPAHVDLVCSMGGNVYAFGDATTIYFSITEGAAVTLQGGAIRNCLIELNQSATAARQAVDCAASGIPACYLDHVGIVLWNLGGPDPEDVAYRAVSSGSSTVLYYVLINFVGDNASRVGIQLGGTAALGFSNGIISDGGSASGGTAVAHGGSGAAWFHNVQLGAPYNQSGFTTDIAQTATGNVFVNDVTFKTATASSSGTLTSLERVQPRRVTGALPTCNASMVATELYDNDTNEWCGCRGGTLTWDPLDGAGTCN